MAYPGYAKILKKLKFPIKLYQILRFSIDNQNFEIFMKLRKSYFFSILTFSELYLIL